MQHKSSDTEAEAAAVTAAAAPTPAAGISPQTGTTLPASQQTGHIRDRSRILNNHAALHPLEKKRIEEKAQTLTSVLTEAMVLVS